MCVCVLVGYRLILGNKSAVQDLPPMVGVVLTSGGSNTYMKHTLFKPFHET